MLWNVDSPVWILGTRGREGWVKLSMANFKIHVTLCHVSRLGTEWPKRGLHHSPPPPPHTFEPALLFQKKKTRNAASHCFQMGSPVQPIRVYVCETAPSLRSAALLPLLCPTRLVKFRVWRRRRGPTCSPCYTTPSGWRLWDGTPFTKNSFLKTSIRFLIY